MREASLLGHDTIGTEHLLLALLADTTCTGTRILTHLTAISPHDMRERIRHQLTEHPPTPRVNPHTSAKSVHPTRPNDPRCTTGQQNSAQILRAGAVTTMPLIDAIPFCAATFEVSPRLVGNVPGFATCRTRRRAERIADRRAENTGLTVAT
ncbi:Clp protease N-terminal domain-containing protein [Rhodococcus sp. NPDC057529]|uniref:Clp protease N-terminal domain-containing protein n=1 Tax=Rhodococcus sp. NPDC057529 TaxID=3346158 RepID=UPI00367210F9